MMSTLANIVDTPEIRELVRQQVMIQYTIDDRATELLELVNLNADRIAACQRYRGERAAPDWVDIGGEG
jgi:hypothetical protein